MKNNDEIQAQLLKTNVTLNDSLFLKRNKSHNHINIYKLSK